MSFGVGLGDVIATTRIAWVTFNALKGAPKEFEGLSLEVLSLHTTLKGLAEEANSPSSLLKFTSAEKQENLRLLLEHCTKGLQQLEKLAVGCKSLGPGEQRRFFERIEFASRSKQGPRDRLAVHTSSLNIFLTSLTHSSLGRLEHLLQSKLNPLIARVEGTFISFGVDKAPDDGFDEAWAAIGRTLASEGVTKSDITFLAPEIIERVRQATDLARTYGYSTGSSQTSTSRPRYSNLTMTDSSPAYNDSASYGSENTISPSTTLAEEAFASSEFDRLENKDSNLPGPSSSPTADQRLPQNGGKLPLPAPDTTRISSEAYYALRKQNAEAMNGKRQEAELRNRKPWASSENIFTKQDGLIPPPLSPKPVRPTYAKIHLQYVEIQTLDFFNLPWKQDPKDSNYVIIEKDIAEVDTNLLFTHTKQERLKRVTQAPNQSPQTPSRTNRWWSRKTPSQSPPGVAASRPLNQAGATPSAAGSQAFGPQRFSAPSSPPKLMQQLPPPVYQPYMNHSSTFPPPRLMPQSSPRPPCRGSSGEEVYKPYDHYQAAMPSSTPSQTDQSYSYSPPVAPGSAPHHSQTHSAQPYRQESPPYRVYEEASNLDQTTSPTRPNSDLSPTHSVPGRHASSQVADTAHAPPARESYVYDSSGFGAMPTHHSQGQSVPGIASNTVSKSNQATNGGSFGMTEPNPSYKPPYPLGESDAHTRSDPVEDLVNLFNEAFAIDESVLTAAS